MAAAEQSASSATLAGTTLQSRYRLTRVIGKGGMGAVYEAVQLPLNKRVAVKVMARELSASDEALARFRREAEVTSQLGHPHIVQVFDFGETWTQQPYLVMEYLDGEDLERRLARVGRFSLATTARVVRQVASALSATHARGIVHRDLKPANVFLLQMEEGDDFVKVVDFGISKVRMATTKLTGERAVLGTPSYMAPEQANGRIDDIDRRTDEWSLACITYEMLAGHPPFRGEDASTTLYQVIHGTPAPVSSSVPGLPPAVDHVLARALSKAQEDRFPTVGAFAHALEAVAAGRPIPADEANVTGVAALWPAPPLVSRPVGTTTTFSTIATVVTGPARSSARGLWGVGRYLVPLAVAVSVAVAVLSFRGPPRHAPPARPATVAARPVTAPSARPAAPVASAPPAAPSAVAALAVMRSPPSREDLPTPPPVGPPPERAEPPTEPPSAGGGPYRAAPPPARRSPPARAKLHLIREL